MHLKRLKPRALQMLKKLLFAFILLMSTNSLSANEITINTTGKPPLNTPELSGFMDLISKEAFKRIGYTLNTVQLPAERGLRNVNAGIEDGEMSRIKGLDKLYPNLIRVPEKIMDWEFVGFSNQPINLDKGWPSLQFHAVTFINGWKILEKNVPQQAEITKVRTPEQLFSILQKQRTDLILYERWGGLLYIKQHKLKGIQLNSPPLAVREMFIYLHKKHIDLVPKLASTLKQMKQDGSYQSIVNKILKPLE